LVSDNGRVTDTAEEEAAEDIVAQCFSAADADADAA